VWIAASIQRRRLPGSLRSPLTLALAAHALTILLSAVFSVDPAVSIPRLPGVLILLVAPLAIDQMDTPRRATAVLAALAAGGVVLSIAGLWQFAHGGSGLDNRIRGSLSHYMTFSGFTMISGCLLLGLLFEGRGRARALGALSALPLAATLLTFTRSAYVGTVAAIVLYLAVRRPRGLLLLVPATLAIFLLAPREIRARILSIGDLQDPTNRDRIAMARAGGAMIAERPVFGVGLNMVKPLYPRYRVAGAPRERVPHLHNNVIQLAAANGIPAAIAYLAAVALFLGRSIRRLRLERRPDGAVLLSGALLAGTAVTVAGLFEYNFGDTEVLMATLLVFAVPFSRATEPLPSPVGANA